MADNWDLMLTELRQIRRAVAGDDDENTPLSLGGNGGTFVNGQNAVICTNTNWVDDRITDSSISDLAPGDVQTIVEMVSNDNDVQVAPMSVATTQHPHDYDSDNVDESAVEYVFERKKGHNDRWQTLSGLTTTVPFGQIGDPTPLLPDAAVGPMAAFRIRFKNITDGESSTTTISAEDIGCELHGRIVRGGD